MSLQGEHHLGEKLGSAPNVAAVAYVKHPVNQGIVQAFNVFIDTIVLCSCTAAIILLSTVYQPGSDVEGVKSRCHLSHSSGSMPAARS